MMAYWWHIYKVLTQIWKFYVSQFIDIINEKQNVLLCPEVPYFVYQGINFIQCLSIKVRKQIFNHECLHKYQKGVLGLQKGVLGLSKTYCILSRSNWKYIQKKRFMKEKKFCKQWSQHTHNFHFVWKWRLPARIFKSDLSLIILF